MSTRTVAAAREPFLAVVRELVRAYQAFQAYDAAKIREFGLTPSQADIVFTLGNTSGMSCTELGEKTLITKGTLTGVIDRLERKKLVRRIPNPDDRRSTIVALTAAGERAFDRMFPAQIEHLRERFSHMSRREMEETGAALRRLRELF